MFANIKATCSIVLAQKGGKEIVWHAVLSLWQNVTDMVWTYFHCHSM